MLPAEIIARKRDGNSLSDDEICFFISGFIDERIPAYQMSALAMAIFFRGMNQRETTSLTNSMLASGERLVWSDGPPVVDKHSTGGIGDKVSLILTPLLSSCGCRVPMLSGRGLGPTGGTLDKLESIRGFRTNLSIAEIQNQVESLGCAITGATQQIVPADQKLYALRDVTGTVASIPLITASIMSKKLAESLDALVLDVKVGNGAFMQSLDDARELANGLVQVGQQMGLKTTAFITDMNQPLGTMIGNAVEVQESISVLQGKGPSDLVDLTKVLASTLLVSSGLEANASDAQEKIESKLQSGHAFEKFEQMVQHQGGDLQRPLAIAKETVIVTNRAGFVSGIESRQLGTAIIEMGGGRRHASDSIDTRVGIQMLVRIGDQVQPNQPLARVYSDFDQQSPNHQRVLNAIQISASPAQATYLVHEMVSDGL